MRLMQLVPMLFNRETSVRGLSIRVLFVAALSLLLAACDSNNVGEVSVADDKSAQIAMSPPQVLLRAIDPNALILDVSVNGETVVMTEDPVTGRRTGTITLPTGTVSDIVIAWSESFEGGILKLGSATRTVNVIQNSIGNQDVFFLQSDFDFSEDTDNDNRSNLQEREEDSDPLDDTSPGIPPTMVPVIVRFQVPDERILQNADILQNITPIATFNGDLLQLARTGDTWVAETLATENSIGFVSVDVFQNPDRRILVATAMRNQSVGGGADINFAIDDYETDNLDEDGDGLTNLEEIIQGFNPLDSNSPLQDPCDTSQFAVGCTTDTDGDGDADSLETEAADTDGDGVPNYLESSNQDQDEDGRNAERDINEDDACIPSTNNVACQNLLSDIDGDGKTDITEGEGDQDGDGVPDVRESAIVDTDNDGVFDETDPANTDPCIPQSGADACLVTTNDSDGDGKPDIQETLTLDTDSDGIPDFLESAIQDADADNRVDELDSSNNDPCVPSTSNTACADQTRDTDGDGETDLSETLTADADSDGTPDFRESSTNDADNDGLSDESDRANNDPCDPSTTNAACTAQTQDTDGDGKTDVIETTTIDSDGDGIADFLESSIFDTDNDTTFDEADSDNTDPCVPSTSNSACTALSQDTDDDGETDVSETLTLDTDGDGIADYLESSLLDADSDGVSNELDEANDNPCLPSTTNAACAAQTLDTDNDGEPDVSETLTIDTDGDGTEDYLESSILDADSDGVSDELDEANANPCLPSTTNAACAAQTLDTDNDGEPDVSETLTIDTDGDGTEDYLESSILDADSDGVSDELDEANANPCLPSTTNAACAAISADTDLDGKTDLVETLTIDTDGDGIFDFQDSAIFDTDGDLIFDELDIDNADPCLPDATTAACVAISTDTDLDGKTDLVETLTIDTDGDGIFDFLDSAILDSDGDLIFDELDIDNADPCLPDATTAACVAISTDTDLDGKTDLVETLTIDTDGDGTFDFLDSAILDTDGDLIFDELDIDNADPCLPDDTTAACVAASGS